MTNAWRGVEGFTDKVTFEQAPEGGRECASSTPKGRTSRQREPYMQKSGGKNVPGVEAGGAVRRPQR